MFVYTACANEFAPTCGTCDLMNKYLRVPQWLTDSDLDLKLET